MIGKAIYVVSALALAVFLISACSGPDEKTGTNRPKIRPGDEVTENGLIIKKYDLNQDKIPDVFKIYQQIINPQDLDKKSVQLLRREIDVNFDGSIDIWCHYLESGKKEKEEFDYDFDGKIDATYFYKDEQIDRKEINVEFDNQPDVFKYYKKGVLVKIERDANNDGLIDSWEYYKRGEIFRIGRDLDADGKEDAWQDIK